MCLGIWIIGIICGWLDDKFAMLSPVGLKFPKIIEKSLKSLNGDSGCSCTKLQKLCQILLGLLPHKFPKPGDSFMSGIKCSLIICILFPVSNVNKRHSIQHHLHFMRLKNANKFLRNHWMESLLYVLYWLSHLLVAHKFNTNLDKCYHLSINYFLFESVTISFIPFALSSWSYILLVFGFFMIILKFKSELSV